MAQIVITGGTGYIGSHVAKYLKNAGYETVVIDRVQRNHTLQYADYFLCADYASHEALSFIKRHRPQAIVHCAGTSLVAPSMTDPGEYYINNVAKTVQLLEYVKTFKHVPSIVFSSSAAVYGSPDTDVIDENQRLNPISPYGQSKAMIEQVLKDYHRAFGLPSLSLRYFNACGANVQDGDIGQEPGATHIVARLLESIKHKKKFMLYGNDYATPDGTCVRDYVHVDDLAHAHMLAIQYLESFGGCNSINLGSNQGYSNREIVDSVELHVGPVDLEFGDRRNGDPDRLIASNSLAKLQLGWSPEHSDLETIVTSAWKWYNNPSQSVD
jgi:UDP-glucose 4-epimerase